MGGEGGMGWELISLDPTFIRKTSNPPPQSLSPLILNPIRSAHAIAQLQPLRLVIRFSNFSLPLGPFWGRERGVDIVTPHSLQYLCVLLCFFDEGMALAFANLGSVEGEGGTGHDHYYSGNSFHSIPPFTPPQTPKFFSRKNTASKCSFSTSIVKSREDEWLGGGGGWFGVAATSLSLYEGHLVTPPVSGCICVLVHTFFCCWFCPSHLFTSWERKLPRSLALPLLIAWSWFCWLTDTVFLLFCFKELEAMR